MFAVILVVVMTWKHDRPPLDMTLLMYPSNPFYLVSNAPPQIPFLFCFFMKRSHLSPASVPWIP